MFFRVNRCSCASVKRRENHQGASQKRLYTGKEFGRARRGVSGSPFRQPATAGRNSSWRRRRGGANCGAALKVGSDAMDACEPRQGRKTATVSLMFHVPSGRLAGALTAASEPASPVETRCTTTFGKDEGGRRRDEDFFACTCMTAKFNMLILDPGKETMFSFIPHPSSLILPV